MLPFHLLFKLNGHGWISEKHGFVYTLLSVCACVCLCVCCHSKMSDLAAWFSRCHQKRQFLPKSFSPWCFSADNLIDVYNLSKSWTEKQTNAPTLCNNKAHREWGGSCRVVKPGSAATSKYWLLHIFVSSLGRTILGPQVSSWDWGSKTGACWGGGCHHRCKDAGAS